MGTALLGCGVGLLSFGSVTLEKIGWADGLCEGAYSIMWLMVWQIGVNYFVG